MTISGKFVFLPNQFSFICYLGVHYKNPINEYLASLYAMHVIFGFCSFDFQPAVHFQDANTLHYI